jgi:hypothetical protein
MKEKNNVLYMEQNEYDEYIKNKKIKVKSDKAFDSGLSLYEINKNLMKNEKSITNKIIKEEKIPIITQFLEDTKEKYYCLLDPHYNYITIFSRCTNDFKNAAIDIIQTCKDLGNIVYLEKTNDNNAIEIWIEIGKKDIPSEVFYLFGYDKGVIEV